MPRWLTSPFRKQLHDLDEKFWAARRNGPLLIEVHYRGGVPQLARLRDILQAPVLLETQFMVASTS